MQDAPGCDGAPSAVRRHRVFSFFRHSMQRPLAHQVCKLHDDAVRVRARYREVVNQHRADGRHESPPVRRPPKPLAMAR